jgi:hypothetical protein
MGHVLSRPKDLVNRYETWRGTLSGPFPPFCILRWATHTCQAQHTVLFWALETSVLFACVLSLVELHLLSLTKPYTHPGVAFRPSYTMVYLGGTQQHVWWRCGSSHAHTPIPPGNSQVTALPSIIFPPTRNTQPPKFNQTHPPLKSRATHKCKPDPIAGSQLTVLHTPCQLPPYYSPPPGSITHTSSEHRRPAKRRFGTSIPALCSSEAQDSNATDLRG